MGQSPLLGVEGTAGIILEKEAKKEGEAEAPTTIITEREAKSITITTIKGIQAQAAATIRGRVAVVVIVEGAEATVGEGARVVDMMRVAEIVVEGAALIVGTDLTLVRSRPLCLQQQVDFNRPDILL